VLIYNTEDELRVAVEKKIGRGFSADEWVEVRPYWNEPYDNGDLNEVVKCAKTKFRKLPKTSKSKGRKSKKKEVIESLQRYYWYADWVFQKGLLPDYRDRRVKDLDSMAVGFREKLGLRNPVRLGELRDILIGLGAKETPPGLRIVYPRRPDDGDYIDVGFLYYDWRKNELLHAVRNLADVLVNWSDWHPAEAIAFLFCNRRPLSRDIPRVYRQGKEITIKVGLDVKPDALAKLYSRTRTNVIREIRGFVGKTARPRQASLRVQTLLNFSLDNPTFKGDELRRIWNEKYPHWQYGSVHSLNAVISRAAKKELSRIDLGIS